jgi:hypothetical protein
MHNNQTILKQSNVSIEYIVEYTFNKSVFDNMEKASFDFNSLDKKVFNNLNQAIQLFIKYKNGNALYCQLFQSVKVGDITVIEDCITDVDFNNRELQLMNEKREEHDQILLKFQSFLHRNKWDKVWEKFKNDEHIDYYSKEYAAMIQ